MSDILAALDELEKQDKKKKASSSAKKTPAQALAEATRQNARRSARTQTRDEFRPKSQPQSRTRSSAASDTRPSELKFLSPNYSGVGRSQSVHSPSSVLSQSESRRISFADPPRVSTRYQVKIATKNDSLGSQFPYDGQKLVKYEISAKEWTHFSNEVVLAADAHHYNALTWPLNRGKVIARVRKDLAYGSGPNPGPVSKVLRRWNNIFKRQGFQARLELPSEEAAEELGRTTAGLNKADQKLAQKEAKRFRIVVSPLGDKGGSIYSRGSSIRGSVSGEGSIMGRLRSSTSSVGKDVVSAVAVKKDADDGKNGDVRKRGGDLEVDVKG